MGKKRRRFSGEYKREVVAMVARGDQSVADLCRDLELRPDMVRRWVKQYGSDPEQSFPGNGKLKQREEELRRLRRENRILREERVILKKVVAIFSEPQQ